MSEDDRLEWYYFDEGCWHGPVSVNNLKSLYFGKEIFESTKVVKHSEITDLSEDEVTESASLVKDLKQCDFFKNTVAKLNLLYNNDFSVRDWKASSAAVPILGFATLVFFLIYIVIISSPSSLMVLELSDSRIVYLLSLSVYIGYWLTYFSSNKNLKFLNVATLRRMLTASSVQWNRAGGNYDNIDDPFSIKHQLEACYREKARAGMTAVAIMIAGSLILLVQTNHYLLLREDLLSLPFVWESVFLTLSALSSFIAFVSFLLSVDALESMFNRYLTEKIELTMVRNFYRFTLNPKYMGLIFLILGITSFAAIHSGLIASIMLWITMSVGYHHWFPHYATVDNDFMDKNDEIDRSLIRSILYSDFAEERVRLIIRVTFFGVFLPCSVYVYLVLWN
jgi:protein-S-isoprenylcysteine O-methyltransferase Ste14